jgi:hypothetical protein
MLFLFSRYKGNSEISSHKTDFCKHNFKPLQHFVKSVAFKFHFADYA